MPVCALEQSVAPFDTIQGFISNEMRACKVPLITVDDAEQSPDSDPVKATELRRATGTRVQTADNRINETAEDCSTRVCGAARLPRLKRVPDSRFPRPIDRKAS